MGGERVENIENLQAKRISVELAMLAKLVDPEVAKKIHELIAAFAKVCEEIKQLTPTTDQENIKALQNHITAFLADISKQIKTLPVPGFSVRETKNVNNSEMPETLTNKELMRAWVINSYQGDTIKDLMGLAKEVVKKSRYYLDSQQEPTIAPPTTTKPMGGH